MSYKQNNYKRYNQENSSYHGNNNNYQGGNQQYGGNQNRDFDYQDDRRGGYQKNNNNHGGQYQQQRPQTAYNNNAGKDNYYNNKGGNNRQGMNHNQSQKQMQQPQRYNDDFRSSQNQQQQQPLTQKYPPMQDRQGYNNKPSQGGYHQQQQQQDPEQQRYREPEYKIDFGKPAGAQQQRPQNNFSQRPQTSKQAVQNTTAVIPQGGQLQLVSNQYKLKLAGEVQVYQYALEIVGMEMWDANLVQKIIRFKRSSLEKALGLYAVSGASVYVISELEDDVRFECSMQGQKYSIKIDKDTQSLFTLSDKFNNSDNSVAQNLLNIIIKQAFRDTDLKQIGKTPRFFDVKNFTDLQESQLRIMSGFKASVLNSQMGCTLVVDSIFKFMSTFSCLSRIMEIMGDKQASQHQREYRCRLEFVDKSVIADWGNNRQYIVHDVVFDQNPGNTFFDHQGDKVSIAEYFKRTYNKHVTQTNQPLFKVQAGQNEFYLPTEFCLLDGVPDSIRKGAGMRDALAHTRITPAEKMQRVAGMIKTLFSQKAVKDWNLEVEAKPINMSTNMLEAPQMINNKQIIKCDEKAMRQNSIAKAVNLLKEKWIMVYENNDRVFQAADKVYNEMCQASKRLGYKVEEPYWIELGKENNFEELDQEIRNYMYPKDKVFREPIIVLCVLQRENNYEHFKEVMLRYQICSQVITFRNAKSFNLSKATNVIRQMNSKCGGDLYNLKMPTVLDNKRTMLIGIDVCHAGPKSIVGFAASINPEMSQYYSERIVQNKNQEIVKDNMKQIIVRAIETFATYHKNEFPTNYVIYRDGVGDAMRDQVLAKEIPQFEEAINALYNKAAYKPAITVVVVNKRISQRFFVTDAQGKMSNPPPGCIIDKQLVEDHGANSEKFDFYMTPALTTQGCVLPTHFYVPKNDSTLKRIDIEQLTYILCYYYFNWAGSIKCPAPTQYAHKIAEFFTNTNDHKKKHAKEHSHEIMAVKKIVEQKSRPIQTKLHYL